MIDSHFNKHFHYGFPIVRNRSTTNEYNTFSAITSKCVVRPNDQSGAAALQLSILAIGHIVKFGDQM